MCQSACSDCPTLAIISPGESPAPRLKCSQAGRSAVVETAPQSTQQSRHLQRDSREIRRAALTLIELVIVMVILSTLAALLIPRLGFMQQQSVNVSGAAGAEGVTNNLETYKVTTGFYPLRFDSLLSNSGTGLAVNSSGGSAFLQGPGGTPPYMPYVAGDLMALDSQGMLAASIGQAFGPASGVYTIMDQDASASLAGEDISSSFNSQRTLYGGSSANMYVATVSQTAGSAIWQAAVPGGTMAAGTGGSAPTYTPPTSAAGVQLVAMGVGPQCSAVGSTMSTAPLQVGMQPGYYSRYVAIFAVYGTGYTYPGKAAELKLVVDAYGNTVSTNIGLYKQAAPIDQ